MSPNGLRFATSVTRTHTEGSHQTASAVHLTFIRQ
jgi:hypothetical protein